MSPGRRREQVRTSWVADRARSCSRSSAGALTSSALRALTAWLRALIADERAARVSVQVIPQLEAEAFK